MNDLVREALCKRIKKDPSLYDDANRCSAMLADDLSGKYTGDIDIIVGAIKEKIPAKMLLFKGKGLTLAQLDSFKNELHDKRSTDETAAQWVVESWALALGLISSNQCTTGGQSSSPSAGSNPTAGTQNLIIQKKPSLLVILGVGGILTLLVAGIYAVSPNGTSNVEPEVLTGPSPPTASPTVSPTVSPTASPTASPSVTPSPTPSPTPPITLAPPPPTINEINNAISKLKAMNPNNVLEFPVKGNPNNALEFPVEGNPNNTVIGFQIGTDKYFGWNVKTVKEFIQESLQYSGKFSESDQITLIVLNQSTKQREIKSLSTNSPLGYFVSFVNSNRVIVKPPQPPTINEINNAISKLKAMNPNEILGFPVEEDPNYIVIGFKRGTDEEKPWNVKTIEDFLQESLQYNGKFPESDQITLTVLNQSTQKRLILKPFSKNSCLGHFVRSLNSS